MPRLTRRIAVRAGLAAGGTVIGALVAGKYLAVLQPDLQPEEPTGAVGPPRLRTLAGLHLVTPPVAMAPFTWQGVAADGSSRPRTLADHAGHGVVLNIWATWCDPCTREMPSLARLEAALRPTGIAVLPVSIDRLGAAPVRTFYRAHAIADLPVLIDPTSSAMSSLGVVGVPTTFLVGPAGDLRARFEGAADWGTPGSIALVRRLIER